jgi:tetratricopeptide (TPR) repeat protein
MSRFLGSFFKGNAHDRGGYEPLIPPSVPSRPATCQGGYQPLTERPPPPQFEDDADAEETPQQRITRLELLSADAYERYEAGDIDYSYDLYSESYLNGDGYKEAGLWMAHISVLKAKQLKPEHLDMFLNKDDALGRIVMAQQFYEQGIREIKHVIRSINSEPREIETIRRAYLQLNLTYDDGLVWEYNDYDDKSETQKQALDMLFEKDSGFGNIEIIRNGIKISLILLTPQFQPAIKYYKEELESKPDDTNILYSIGMMYFFLSLTIYHSGKPELQERARNMLFNSKVYFDKLLVILGRQPMDDYNNDMIKKVKNYLKRLNERIGGVCPRLLSVGGGKSRTRRNKSRTRRNKSRKIKKRIRTKK